MPTQATGLCASCSQPLGGRFCSHCGEQAFDPHALTVRHFVTHTMAHEMLHLDGKIWRTLRLLVFKPGSLDAEYSAGRRQPYINPVRLFLTAIVFYALLTQGGLQASLFVGRVVLSIAPAAVPKGASIEQTIERIDRYGLLGRLLARRAQTIDLRAEATRERFHSKLDKFAQPLSFLNVVALAVVMYALFHRRRRLFVEHAVFSMHFVTFVLLSSPVYLPMLYTFGLSESRLVLLLIVVMIAWQFVYLATAIRRFYLGDRPGRVVPIAIATAAAVLVYVVNSAFITASQLLGGAIALATL